MIRLLVSPQSISEAYEVIKGKGDIIDIKRPTEGSLGANFPWVIREIKKIAPKHTEISATLGDLPNLPGTASLAALGLAHCGVDYIKAGIKGPKTKEDAIFLMKQIHHAVRDLNAEIKIVAAGYADAERFGGISPLLIPEIAAAADSNIAMLDTAIKDGKRLFDYLQTPQLTQFVELTHDYGLQAALAGSIEKDDLISLIKIKPDIIGVRGAVCEQSDRVNGRIRSDLVQEFVQILKTNSSSK
ncbi:MAG TPA: (5-formylfuran-3-yl)methyl phosphate synthase [Candidatus Deferrimicrobium sp.]|nr:(5-formylfuran-3-yl)methyl phosphate synthase [Candidatus Deferrimicrobium sp.]